MQFSSSAYYQIVLSDLAVEEGSKPEEMYVVTMARRDLRLLLLVEEMT